MSDATSTIPLLEVEGLTTVFDTPSGPLRAVDEVSFSLAAGETLGLVGESGCGKSVTALSILGLVPPPGRIATGSIRFGGRELVGLTEPELRLVRGAAIALVFQEPMAALNPVFTVGTQVAEALVVHGRASWAGARLQAIELLDAVRLPDPARTARDYPHQLSGGMRQRVLLAIALACRPSLLVADEPTTALDVTIQADILDLLREMRAAYGLSLLLITHDLGVVASMAHRVAVMYAGRVVESAPVGPIFSRPRHPYTRALLASIPGRTPGRRLVAIDGTPPNPAALPRGCAFAPRCPERLPHCSDAPPPLVSPSPDEAVRCYLHLDPRLDAPRDSAGRSRTPGGAPPADGGGVARTSR